MTRKRFIIVVMARGSQKIFSAELLALLYMKNIHWTKHEGPFLVG